MNNDKNIQSQHTHSQKEHSQGTPAQDAQAQNMQAQITGAALQEELEHIPSEVKQKLDFSSLNPAQLEAVLCTEGPLLVLAGAGSGKTRVLTTRIAYMIAARNVQPYEILAITFTNKAAAEMRERLHAQLDGFSRGMWICTFHAMCVRILRDEAKRLGYTSSFTIYDDDDSKRLIKSIASDLSIDTKTFDVNGIRSRISDAKNKLITPAEYASNAASPLEDAAAKVYEELQVRLHRQNAMDFDDLLTNTHHLFTKFPEVLKTYQDRFSYISVDEYQDTNHVQYELTNMLAGEKRNLMVVGDDDQSIYSWRGADIQNILDFEKDYPDAKVVKLQQNYRSTGHILSAANAVVERNVSRRKKELFTTAGAGDRVYAYQATDERDEGRWIAAEAEKLNRQGISYDEMAVFYRTNVQSRVLEDMFLRAGVPYKIVGGTRFFDRAEIRDVMAYLKLILNPADDVSAQRIINVPRRGIGATSIDKISAFAVQNRMSFFEACVACVADQDLLTQKVREALAAWTSQIEAARHYAGELSDVIEMIVEKAGIIDALKTHSTIEAQGRLENIQEFLLIAKEFDESHDDVVSQLESLAELRQDKTAALYGQPLPGKDQFAFNPEASTQAQEQQESGQRTTLPEPEVAAQKLPAFMEWLALRSDLDSLAGQSSAVTLMTIHSAKGLEFPVVFVAGLEEGLFPNLLFDTDPQKLEEERRLAYVAITRARKTLYLTYAATRRTYGSTSANKRSRFVDEVPDEDMELVGVGSAGFSGFGWEKRGDRHGMYGTGGDLYGSDGGVVFGVSGTRGAAGRQDARDKGGSWTHAEQEGAPSLSGAWGSPTAGNGGVVQEKRKKETFQKGDAVHHKIFGDGIVMDVKGDELTVHFEKSNQTKHLLLGFAPLVKIQT